MVQKLFPPWFTETSLQNYHSFRYLCAHGSYRQEMSQLGPKQCWLRELSIVEGYVAQGTDESLCEMGNTKYSFQTA